MNVSNFAVRLAAAAALSCAVSAAHAAFTFATVATGGDSNAAAQTYAASVTGARDSFGDLTINDPTPLGISLNRTVYPGPVTYTLSTQSNLYSVQSPGIGGPAVTVENNTDSLTFSNFGGIGPQGVLNFGASFYLSELNAANAVAGSMSVKATDTNGLVQTFTFAQGSSSNVATLYFTLASSVALQSVELIAPTPLSNSLVFATVDNVVLAPVPTPGSWLLMLSGGAVMLRLSQRRRG
jgi:hypothetical protein